MFVYLLQVVIFAKTECIPKHTQENCLEKNDELKRAKMGLESSNVMQLLCCEKLRVCFLLESDCIFRSQKSYCVDFSSIVQAGKFSHYKCFFLKILQYRSHRITTVL